MAREWIIQTERRQIGDSNNYDLVQIANGVYVGKDKVKVIEHSAYLELQQQLARAEEVISLIESKPAGINYPENNEIEQLCELLGYGAVMQAASQMWMKKDPIGALTVGPCAWTINEYFKEKG